MTSPSSYFLVILIFSFYLRYQKVTLFKNICFLTLREVTQLIAAFCSKCVNNLQLRNYSSLLGPSTLIFIHIPLVQKILSEDKLKAQLKEHFQERRKQLGKQKCNLIPSRESLHYRMCVNNSHRVLSKDAFLYGTVLLKI